jgi:hypothetical protein
MPCAQPATGRPQAVKHCNDSINKQRHTDSDILNVTSDYWLVFWENVVAHNRGDCFLRSGTTKDDLFLDRSSKASAAKGYRASLASTKQYSASYHGH